MRLPRLLSRAARDEELDEEIRTHLAMAVRDRVARGESPVEAERAARREFGNVALVKEVTREHWRGASLELLGRDLRRAARRLRREPAFLIPAAITLGVGIGAASAVFALANAILLRPLPYQRADRLVAVTNVAPGIGLTDGGLSDGTYLHYRKHNRVFEEIGSYFDRTLSITDRGAPERIQAALVTSSVFGVLRARPLVGRLCTAGDDAGEPIKVVIAHGLWVRRYGADPRVIGRMIELNRRPRQIVGVAPPDFRFPHADTQLWFCMPVDSTSASVRDLHQTGIARLRDGVSPARAQAELQRLIPGLVGAYPDATPELLRQTRLRAVVTPLKDVMLRDVRPALVLLLGAVGLVLAIAAANVANLFLVRAERRRHEVAIARALGAGTRDVARQLLAESTSVALIGGALALGVAFMGVETRFGFAPGQIPRLHELRFDGAVIGVTTALSLVVGVVLGLASLARVMASGDAAALRAAAARATPGRAWQRAQRSLVGVQVMLALALLIASAAMVQSVWRMQRVRLGFDPTDVLTFEVALPFQGYDKYQKGAHFFHELTRQLRAVPGVTAAEATYGIPLTPTPFVSEPVTAVGEANVGDAPPVATGNAVTPGYFGAMRMQLLAGRGFEPGDLVNPEHPVVVSASLARALYGRDYPVGRRLRLVTHSRDTVFTVVGVVGDVPGETIVGGAARTLYFPVLEDLAATPDADAPISYYPTEMTVVVRTSLPPTAVVSSARRIVNALDPRVPVARVRTLEQVVASATSRARLTALLLLVAAGAALVLGAVGIYGVISYAVSQRTTEFGVRLAVGASPRSLRRMVVRQGLMVATAGVGAGLFASVALMQLLRSVLYQVSPTDPLVFGSMTVMLLVIAVLASYVPALRASRTDPTVALRAG